MSNILIIKHGSLGDIVQSCGAIQDISENHRNDKVYLLTTKPYFELFKKNPHIYDVILDKRLSRLNLIYLFSLMKKIKNFKFSKIYDLQNSSRTTFYRRILFPNSNSNKWSSSETTLPNDQPKEEFDKKPVLDRFNHQLKNSGLTTKYTMFPDFSWSCSDISKINLKYNLKKYIILFPFCSPHLTSKKWPYFNELIEIIKNKYKDEYKILIAPGPDEIDQSKQMNAECILDEGVPLDISKLSSLIKNSIFVVTNDTGPAHMAAHLGSNGLVLFGHHTSPHKVSIETEKFKALTTNQLAKLSAQSVYSEIENKLKLISR